MGQKEGEQSGREGRQSRGAWARIGPTVDETHRRDPVSPGTSKDRPIRMTEQKTTARLVPSSTESCHAVIRPRVTLQPLVVVQSLIPVPDAAGKELTTCRFTNKSRNMPGREKTGGTLTTGN